MDIRTLVEKSHEVSLAHGWWKGSATVEQLIVDKLALIHSEVSEALEDYRNGNMTMRYEHKEEAVVVDHNPGAHAKPCGFPSELADIVIRVADLAGALDIDLEQAIVEKMTYNEKRPYRHGGKRA